jgi:hypothetical protein
VSREDLTIRLPRKSWKREFRAVAHPYARMGTKRLMSFPYRVCELPRRQPSNFDQLVLLGDFP